MNDIQKEIDKAYNENSKIPFMLSKDIFSYAFKLGFNLSKSQIDNLSGQVKFFKKSNEELRKDVNNEEFKKKVSKKSIEYDIYKDLVYKLKNIFQSGNTDKLYSLYDDVCKKLELLNLELNKK